MRSDRWRGQVVSCAILASICAGFDLMAFRANTWGTWTKGSNFKNCLPLPPPIGCSDTYHPQQVIDGADTDFAWLCIFNCLVSIGTIVCALSLLSDGEKDLFGFDEKTVRRSLLRTFLLAGLISFLTCLIASFRIHASANHKRRQGIFGTGGLTPVYSISFYLICVNFLLSLFGSFISHQTEFNRAPDNLDLAKTTKQHMARNLMYPDDQRATKMVTFSSMRPEMEEIAAEIAVKAVMNFTNEEDIAENIKQTFETQYGPTWHCAVGSSFGSAVEHINNDYIEVSLPQQSVLLFRCTEPGGSLLLDNAPQKSLTSNKRNNKN